MRRMPTIKPFPSKKVLKNGAWCAPHPNQLLVLLICVSAMIVGCDTRLAEGGDGHGDLTVSIELPVREGPRTIAPSVHLTVASYDIELTGPSGEFRQTLDHTTAEYTESDLATGDWTVSVTARNSDGTEIASGSEVVTIGEGGALLTMTLSFPDGTGELDLKISWPGGSIISPSVSATFGPAGGTPTSLTLSQGNTAYVFESTETDLAPGYYVLSLFLSDGTVARYGIVESVLVLAGSTTFAHFFLEEDDLLGESVADVEFSPAGGSYSSSQTVTLSSTTDGATIYYTTNGQDPDPEYGTLYDGSVAVSSTVTIRAAAYKTSMIPSPVSSSAYTINNTCAAPVFDQKPGIHYDAVTVNITSATDGATIMYTTNGTTPTDTTGTVYDPSNPVIVSVDTTLKAMAKKTALISSSVSSIYYGITGSVADVTADISAGTYYSTQSVTLSCSTPSSSIYYTLNGTTPSEVNGELYDSAISVSETLTLKAVAVREDWESSSVLSADYVLKCGTPTFSLAAGTYVGSQTVTITNPTSDITIYYTTDGTTPTDTGGTAYTTGEVITISSNATLQAVAVKDGWEDSTAASAVYNIQVAAPTFSPPAGYFVDSTGTDIIVTLACTTEGATIIYTINSTDPSTSNGTYGSSVTIDSDTTIRAMAVKSGLTDSEITEGVYYLDSGLSPSPTDGATGVSLTPTLTWATSTSSVGYEIEVNTSDLFDGTVIVPATSVTEASYRIESGLTPGQTYHWRVRYELTAGSFSGWETVSFTAGDWSYTKYTSNPVLDIGESGEFDSVNAFASDILLDDGTYRMWYTGYDGTDYTIGLAESTDGISWSKYSENPVLRGLDAWELGYVAYPSVLLGEDGTYRMWYTGGDGTNYRIGYATSSDGYTWTKHAGNPVLQMGAATAWDDEYVNGPTVIYREEEYKLWYSGFDGTYNRIGYATSSDGISWLKEAANPVMDLGAGGYWDDYKVYNPAVVFDGTLYHMWYAGNDESTYHRIGHAYSTDGVSWNRIGSSYVIDRQSGWEYYQASFPAVILEDGAPRIWYSGRDSSGNYRIGYAYGE